MPKTIRYGTAALLVATLCCSNVLAQQPVIPGAAGFGMNTSAGRGGKIIKVTNLNDSGPGSLRACVEASGPRYCIFEVSGVIRLKKALNVTNPNITIAGQTAPDPGIMLRGHALQIRASDVLVQHIASRVGAEQDGSNVDIKKALKINGASGPIRNVVIDHCSLSWAVDENLSTYKDWGDVTISNSITSEPLRESISSTGSHGYGALIDTNTASSKISFIGNLFAHGYSRNPRSNAAGFVFVNNVVYNAGDAAVMLYNRHGIKTNNSIVGNVFIAGPNTVAKPIRLTGESDGQGWNEILLGTRVYLADNFAADASNDPWSIVHNKSSILRSLLEALNAPSWPDGMEIMSTKNDLVLEHVLKNAGSRPGQRNSVDARVVANVRNGTGQIINCVDDDGTSRCAKNAGGWPILASNTRRLDVPRNPDDDEDGDGYTNVEEWLHVMAAEVEGQSSSPSQPDDPAPPAPPDRIAPPKAPVLQD